MIQVRGILIAETFDKSRTPSQCKTRETAALTLMSKDVEDVVPRNFYDEYFRDNLLRTLSDQSPTRVRVIENQEKAARYKDSENSKIWRNCLPWRPPRLDVAGTCPCAHLSLTRLEDGRLLLGSFRFSSYRLAKAYQLSSSVFGF